MKAIVLIGAALTGPFRSADSAQPPLLTFGGAIEQRTSVAGTLQGAAP